MKKIYALLLLSLPLTLSAQVVKILDAENREMTYTNVESVVISQEGYISPDQDADHRVQDLMSQASSSIWKTLQKRSDMTLMVKLLQNLGLSASFDSESSAGNTLLAIPDEVFQSYFQRADAVAKSLDGLTSDQQRALVRSFSAIVPEHRLSSSLWSITPQMVSRGEISAQDAALLLGQPLYDWRVYIYGCHVSQTDIPCTNGLIHVLSDMPNLLTTEQVLTAENEDFTTKLLQQYDAINTSAVCVPTKEAWESYHNPFTEDMSEILTQHLEENLLPGRMPANTHVLHTAYTLDARGMTHIIYTIDHVLEPEVYSTVLAPLHKENTRVMRTVVCADDDYVNGTQYNNAPLKQYYSTYLKAVPANFSLFVPTDEGLEQHGYVDPASMGGKYNYYTFWSWAYKPFTTDVNTRRLAIDAVGYRYDKTKDNDISTNSKRLGYFHSQNTTLYATDSEGKKTYGPIKEKLLTEMINQHLIVHDDAQGLLSTNQRYFLSRSGAPVYVSKQGDATGKGMEVKGGWQLQLDKEQEAGTAVSHTCVVETAYDQTGGAEGYGNGRTYLLSRPMQATTLSTYAAMSQNPDICDFMRLCVEFDQSVLDSAGFREINEEEVHQHKPAYDYTDDDWANASTLYRVFVTGEVGKSTYYNPDNLVRFFNNYRYTVYAPTNEAMQNAFAIGLMKWSEIKAYINDHLEFVKGSTTAKYLPAAEKEKVRKMVTLLVNFLKYHFQDESLFVDNVNNSGNYQTACVDNERNIYVPLKVVQTNGSIKVTDQNGDTQSVSTEDGKYNVLARDAHFSRNPKWATYNQDMYITTSSYAVVHQIDKVLNFMSLKSLPNQRYDDLWNTTNSTTKKFAEKYRIR